jgi:hypothetical protein
MNDSDWAELMDCTIFIAPETVEGFWDASFHAIAFPPTFRGTLSAFPEAVRISGKGERKVQKSGYPVPVDGIWYSLWGMRPSRYPWDLALGLELGDLEKNPTRVVQCKDGCNIKKTWEVHHIYDLRCLTRRDAKVNAERFTNLANLVLMVKSYHKTKSTFVHGGPGAAWLRYIISELYPNSSLILGPAPGRPTGSPGKDDIHIAVENKGALERLRELRISMPAGSREATRKWMDKREGNNL